jgi:putative chitinase
MCVNKSVGEHCANHRDDVKIVQIMLNLNLYQLIPLAPLPMDGRFSKNLQNAVLEFQRRVMKAAKPDGRVEPDSQTMKMLRAGVPSAMSATKMQGIFLHAPQAVITKFYPGLTAAMASIAINTPLRMAHFLSQVGHESMDLHYTEEIASGEAYEGRKDLGNTQPGDGVRFKGRGLIQLTGRANYKAYGDARGKDYTISNNWTLIATDPALAVDVSAYFWDKHHLNTLADHDSVDEVTRVINGGTNGIADRRQRLAIAKCFLMTA